MIKKFRLARPRILSVREQGNMLKAPLMSFFKYVISCSQEESMLSPNSHSTVLPIYETHNTRF